MIERVKAHIKVYLAYLTNNRTGKSVDVHGRTYRSVYKQFGHTVMFNDYYHYSNTWFIKQEDGMSEKKYTQKQVDAIIITANILYIIVFICGVIIGALV